MEYIDVCVVIMATEKWKVIKFSVSPGLYEKLKDKKGKRKWWEFFRDEYDDKKPSVVDEEAEFKAARGR